MIPAGLLDTSVFIASETGRPLDESAVPEEVATTVITLGELNAGVLAAGSPDVRARRLATLDAVADMVALPVDEDAARVWARLRLPMPGKRSAPRPATERSMRGRKGLAT